MDVAACSANPTRRPRGRNSWLSNGRRSRIPNREALHRRLAATVTQGGEGPVLHLASAASRPGRSDATTKLKPELDTEAVVVAHCPGQGRYTGQLGAPEVGAPDGRQFLIGSGFSDAQRRDQPAVGSVVAYR
jgi:DNA ligase-1